MKKCSRCAQTKPLDQFYASSVSKDKRQNYCRSCRAEHERDRRAPSREANRRKLEARNARTEQTCTRCEETKPIEEFSFRNDRPEKRRSQCIPCWKEVCSERNHRYSEENFEKIAASKRKYHAANPGYNDVSIRRRRARAARVKTEDFTRAEIRERDGDRCYLCGGDIDPSLKWPDPYAATLHHLHPISKYGPNIAQNTVLAHSRCNIQQKNGYKSPFVDWRVSPIDRDMARTLAEEHHYMHRKPNISFAFGLFDSVDELRGFSTFGTPTSSRIGRSIFPSDIKRVIEFNRLWIEDSVPYGAATWFVSRALKELPPLIVVTYADLSAGHTGSVYRALSFNFAGQTKPRKEYRLPGKSRNVGKVPGAVQCVVPARRRFWTVTGTPAQKRALRSLVEWPSLTLD